MDRRIAGIDQADLAVSFEWIRASRRLRLCRRCVKHVHDLVETRADLGRVDCMPESIQRFRDSLKQALLVIGKDVDRGKVVRRITVDFVHSAIAVNRHAVYFRHHSQPPTPFLHPSQP